ncbi:RAD52 motif-containing protein 1 isoform X4 [Entelurus aequoreus]|uniref:RAD52 motif-containing protein 1 isoform X4 n=1 Tax=Entelurus aequoreus TaxID=161455 RepID=UPI002B1DFD8B|nr:RAD52 motif-containing protein 1 isoform X4 [Entelurus aequoreus]
MGVVDTDTSVMEVDILEFVVPVENNKCVFVWDIEANFTEAHIYEGLYAIFSSFGPLYLLKVCPNAPMSAPGFYALIKFYSALHAQKAQQHTDGHSLFQNSPLKVRLSSKRGPHFLSRCRPLSHAHCVELANHCLGFNGWTSDIITLKELPADEEEEEEGEGGAKRQQLRLGCLLQLSFPRHGVTTRGVALVEDSVTCTGPDAVLQTRRKLHRMARDKALSQAFSAVLLVLLGDGKVMVELRQTSEHLFSEDTVGLVQVRDWDQATLFPAEEDECGDEDLDLTVW